MTKTKPQKSVRGNEWIHEVGEFCVPEFECLRKEEGEAVMVDMFFNTSTGEYRFFGTKVVKERGTQAIIESL